MLGGDALALDSVATRRGNVEEEINEVIFEQVHLVYVEEAAVRAREQAGLEGSAPFGERALDVERARDAILRRVERQLDDGDARALGGKSPSRGERRAA